MIGVIIIISILVSLMAVTRKEKFQFDPQAKDGTFQVQDPTVMQSLQERVDQNYFRLQINSNPVVNSESRKANLMISNPADNDNAVYIDIYLEEAKQLVYHSKKLNPGDRVVYDYLSEQLKPGDYSAVAVYSLLEDDSEEVVGEFEAALMISVE